MKMKLEKGSKIDISASARKLVKADLKPVEKWVQSFGLELVYTDELFKESHQFAGSDKHRAALLQSYINNDELDAIWIARGGYGSARFIDRIDWSRMLNKPKLLIGFSDITVLHCDLYKKTGLSSLHATMPLSFPSNTAESKNALIEAFQGVKQQFQVPGFKLNREGECEGVVIGGNLSVLYSILSSPSEINLEGKILFIEDLDEYLYHIDRMMLNLKRSGRLEKLAGLVVGGMTDMNDNMVPFGKTAEEIIAEHVSEYDYPLAFNFPIGHLDQNMPLRLGAVHSLNVSPNKASLVEH